MTIKKGSNKMIVGFQELLLAAANLLVPAKLPRDRLDHIENVINDTARESQALAKSLNVIADTKEDPFKEFAHRARQSQFKRLIEKGEG